MPWLITSSVEAETKNLDSHLLAIRLARLDRLSRLLDRVEDGVVVERFGLDNGGLVLERDVVFLDACMSFVSHICT